MPRHTPFKATLLASLVGTALSPAVSWAQYLFWNLAQSPPATLEPFVAPNVILSLDDSGSMNWQLTNTAQGRSLDNPDPSGTWPANASRSSILRHALRTVFNDTQLLPDGSIRLAWLTMGDCARRNRRIHDGQWVDQTPARVSAATLDSASHTGNAMRVLDQEHRDNFLDYVNSYYGCAWTPTHTLVSQADRYMRGALNVNSPWASVPGRQGPPYLGCRRNYHILMTDGGWNFAAHDTGNQIPGTPNFDGTSRTLPDGMPYDPAAAQNRIYGDNDTGTNNADFSTVADWSFRSWAQPLQSSGLTGSPRPSAEYRRAPPQETFTSSDTTRRPPSTVTLDKYWNPRFDPATWPHMVTHTLGFSSFALPHSNYANYAPDGRVGPMLTPPSGTLPYGFDGNFADYANGTFVWRAAGRLTGNQQLPPPNSPLGDRGHDMWHAAINGRGSFYAVNRSEDLAMAFRQIFQQINVETEPGRSSAATSGSTITRSAVGLYTASYDPQQAWRGAITGQRVASGTDASGKPTTSTTPLPGWQGQTTAQRLDALSESQVLQSRTILAWNDDQGQGVPFQWNAIGTRHQNLLDRTLTSAADGLGARRLEYLRGMRRMEGTATPPSYPASRPFRQRHSRQGDIVNSAIWYTGTPASLYPEQDYKRFAATHKGRTPMLYVGGNDGMLHGFSAEDGSEKLAYVPRGVMRGLSQLTDPGYNDRHRYFVDGSPMTGDIHDGNQWKTIVVGTLGAGGKGYFVLDVTDPSRFQESNARSLVLLDRSMHATEFEERPTDCALQPDAQAREKCEVGQEMGHIFAAPVLDESDPQRSSQIALLNNNRWAVVMGNGYNSPKGQAVLLIQFLDGNRELLRLQTTGRKFPCYPSVAGGNCDGWSMNGLSAPRLVDINGDGRPDVVYAGDLNGNVWKFLIASEFAANWRVAFGDPPKIEGWPFIFNSMFSNAGTQSVTTAPVVRANDRKQVVKNAAGQDETLPLGGLMVAFGTGRNITVEDPTNYQGDWGLGPQKLRSTIYSVLDRTRYKQVVGTDGRSRVELCVSMSDPVCKLRAGEMPEHVNAWGSKFITLTQDSSSVTGQGASAGRTFSKVEGGGSVDWTQLDWSEYKGWRFDLPEDGERLLKPMAFFDSSNVLAIYSQVPATSGDDQGEGDSGSKAETCEIPKPRGERQFLTLLNIMDGKPPSVQIMDANGDGIYSAADGGVNRMTTSSGAQSLIVGGDRITAKGDQDQEDVFARMPEQPARPSWRQLQ